MSTIAVMVEWTGQTLIEVDREDGETAEQVIVRLRDDEMNYELVSNDVIARMETYGLDFRLPEVWEQ